METPVQVVDYLKTNLGYCGCASENTITILLSTLEIVAARTDSIQKKEIFSMKTNQLRELLHLNYDTQNDGLGEWFIYLLESKGLVYHDRAVSDCWITMEGRNLLKGLSLLGRNFRITDLAS